MCFTHTQPHNVEFPKLKGEGKGRAQQGLFWDGEMLTAAVIKVEVLSSVHTPQVSLRWLFQTC